METAAPFFAAADLRARLEGDCVIGHALRVERCVDSTNARLKAEAADRPDGYALLAHCQTAGRGRLGRTFASPAGDGLYLSVLLRPDLPPADFNFITTAAAVAACRAIEQAAGFAPGVKWVNDILMAGKKLCGILVEGGFTDGRLDHAVLGLGVNLRFDPAAHPALADIAGGLEDFAARPVDPLDLAACLLRELDRVYALLRAGERAAILDDYRARLLGLGETITVHGTDGPYPARCVGLDDRGHLRVETAAGVRVLSAGEISIRLPGQRGLPAAPNAPS